MGNTTYEQMGVQVSGDMQQVTDLEFCRGRAVGVSFVYLGTVQGCVLCRVCQLRDVSRQCYLYVLVVLLVCTLCVLLFFSVHVVQI